MTEQNPITQSIDWLVECSAYGEWLFKLNDAGMGVGKQLNEDQP